METLAPDRLYALRKVAAIELVGDGVLEAARPKVKAAGTFRKANIQKKTNGRAVKSKPRAVSPKTPKPKAKPPANRQSSTAKSKSEAKRMETLERLVAEYVAAKQDEKPAKGARKKGGK